MNRDEGVRTPVRGDRDERYDSLQRAHTTWDAYQDHYEHRLGMPHEEVVAAWNALQSRSASSFWRRLGEPARHGHVENSAMVTPKAKAKGKAKPQPPPSAIAAQEVRRDPFGEEEWTLSAWIAECERLGIEPAAMLAHWHTFEVVSEG